MSISGNRPLKFDLVADRNLLNEPGKNGTSSYASYLQAQEKEHSAPGKPFEFASQKPAWFPSGEQNEGPFEVTPDLAQVRIVHSVGMVMNCGKPAVAKITWANIVQSLQGEMKDKLTTLSASQTLPASVKIVAATVGDHLAYRNMCHVKVYDGSANRKLMNTPHLYRKGDTPSSQVGYPLHLLTDEGGFVLEEPPQLTETFKHYWYISNSMLTSFAYKQETAMGTFISIPKNSDAARLMYYVLVVKNGAGAGSSENDGNVTGLTAAGFEANYNDKNDFSSWRFPESTFNEVTSLLSQKLKDVRDKSFNCGSIEVEVQAFDTFRDTMLIDKGHIPVLITLEIDLHLPMVRDATTKETSIVPAAKGRAARNLDDFNGEEED